MYHLTHFMMKHLRLEKSHGTGNLLSDVNDRVLGFLLNAGNWKIKSAKISKFTAYCAIWV